jgi:small GTP-binding protein
MIGQFSNTLLSIHKPLQIRWPSVSYPPFFSRPVLLDPLDRRVILHSVSLQNMISLLQKLAEMHPSSDLKIIVLGPAFVGKTSLIVRQCHQSFSDNTSPTIGVGFFTGTFIFSDSEITVVFWDTVGTERFRSVTPSLLRGANGLILVFDLTRPSTLEDLTGYLKMFHDTIHTTDIPVLLLGNKCDLEAEVGDATIEEWCKTHSISCYSAVSAKTGANLENAIRCYIEPLVKVKRADGFPPVSLPLIKPQPSRVGGCC